MNSKNFKVIFSSYRIATSLKIKEKNSEFPLRKLCKVKTDLLGNPVCYYFPI